MKVLNRICLGVLLLIPVIGTWVTCAALVEIKEMELGVFAMALILQLAGSLFLWHYLLT